ncbi:response regulator transcription factor [Candidatus Nitronereus thalassa]|uniref:Response regulator transcription factor n=1 Tax=Candidatus Nitronereus thalassa TaxID=3020898 RepID=A0ABU3K769_9BACT|nr:response regulator transcription factor [Candidatus Nitronereus thalassa]MDT7042212.1 response regulator transcription factor [Candidatus Nitronereus thalassa]
MTLRIILVDDHQLFRDGLHSLFEQQEGFAIVGEAKDGRNALRLVQEIRPDVLIMDASMPGMNGIEATRQIKADYPEVKVLVVSMHEDRRFVVAALEAGADGYLVKDCPWEEFIQAVHAVQANYSYLCPQVAGYIADAYRKPQASSGTTGLLPLTGREREVLQLLAEGQTTEHIATLLHISNKTVHTHRNHIMNKLHIDNLADLTKYAIREGLTTLE